LKVQKISDEHRRQVAIIGKQTKKNGWSSLRQAANLLAESTFQHPYKQKSTIITTNLPFAQWGNIIDNTTVATAIADRLVYNSEILVMEGKSYRKRA
jgi:DNA replication protein DnaC